MMRIIGFLLSLLFTAGLIYVLDTRTVIPAPLGKLLSPQEGLWQNAEPVNAGFDDELRFPELKGKVEVFIDERLVLFCSGVFACQVQVMANGISDSCGGRQDQ
jgi:penicillin G amidase